MFRRRPAQARAAHDYEGLGLTIVNRRSEGVGAGQLDARDGPRKTAPYLVLGLQGPLVVGPPAAPEVSVLSGGCLLT